MNSKIVEKQNDVIVEILLPQFLKEEFEFCHVDWLFECHQVIKSILSWNATNHRDWAGISLTNIKLKIFIRVWPCRWLKGSLRYHCLINLNDSEPILDGTLYVGLKFLESHFEAFLLFLSPRFSRPDQLKLNAMRPVDLSYLIQRKILLGELVLEQGYSGYQGLSTLLFQGLLRSYVVDMMRLQLELVSLGFYYWSLACSGIRNEVLQLWILAFLDVLASLRDIGLRTIEELGDIFDCHVGIPDSIQSLVAEPEISYHH